MFLAQVVCLALLSYACINANWQKSLKSIGVGFKKTFIGLLPIGEICISPGFSLGCDLAFE